MVIRSKTDAEAGAEVYEWNNAQPNISQTSKRERQRAMKARK